VFGSNQVQDGSIECGAAAIRGVAETPVQSATATATDGTPTVAMTVASGNLGFAYAASEDAFGAPVDAAWQPVEVAQGSYGNGLWQQWIEGIASTPDVSWSLSGSDDWGLIAIEFQRLKPAPGRSGDDFASAIPISGRGFHYRLASDKVALYTAQDFEENIGVLFYTLWFSWKPAVGTYTIDTTGSGYTPIITLMSGTWWIPTFIDSNNPNLTFTADGVTTYYIQIGGFFDGDFGNLTLSVT